METKEIRCACGHVTVLSTPRLRCEQCGKHIFYDDRERRRFRNSHIYVLVLMSLAFGFLAYLFVEMVMVPFFPR